MRIYFKMCLFLSCISLISTGAYAHSEGFSHLAGFSEGFLHPFTGIDHLLAILSVGVLTAQRGKERAWMFPTLFISVMLLGGWIGVKQMSLPLVEVGICTSLIVLGVLLVVPLKVNTLFFSVLVTFFAFFHGHAHGSEFLEPTRWSSYACGFTAATALLQGVGVAIGMIASQSLLNTRLLKCGGMAIILVGGLFLTTTIL